MVNDNEMNNSSYYNPTFPSATDAPFSAPQQGINSTLLLITDTNEDLREMELTLRGLREDKEGNLLRIGKPLMNEEGVKYVISNCRSAVSRASTMSNIKDKNITKIMEYISRDFICGIMIGRIKYEVDDFESVRNLIVNTALIKSYLCLKRAEEGGERRFLKGTSQEITMKQEQRGSSASKGGAVEKAMGWIN